MAKTAFDSVDEYIASQTGDARRAVILVRRAVCDAVPGIQESICYNMPTYTLDGKHLVHLAVWKHHYSIYGSTRQLLETFSEELAPYQVEKGTIRFPLCDPVPVELIGRLAKFRANEVSG